MLLALLTILFSFAVLHHLTLSLAVDPVVRPAMHPAVHRHAVGRMQIMHRRGLLYAEPREPGSSPPGTHGEPEP